VSLAWSPATSGPDHTKSAARIRRTRWAVVRNHAARSFAHLLEMGRLRRVHVRGHKEIRKRMLIHVAAFNLGLLMRRRFGVGTPRSLQGRPPQRKL